MFVKGIQPTFLQRNALYVLLEDEIGPYSSSCSRCSAPSKNARRGLAKDFSDVVHSGSFAGCGHVGVTH